MIAIAEKNKENEKNREKLCKNLFFGEKCSICTPLARDASAVYFFSPLSLTLFELSPCLSRICYASVRRMFRVVWRRACATGKAGPLFAITHTPRVSFSDLDYAREDASAKRVLLVKRSKTDSRKVLSKVSCTSFFVREFRDRV